jgi:acetyl-CoA carboxylase carboxyltransferase component
MSSRRMIQKLTVLDRLQSRLRYGGGTAKVRSQHAKGKLTARERIEKLLDPGTFQELDLWGSPMATGTLSDYKQAPADAVAVGYGTVNGRPIYVWSQDATLLGGTMGTMHARKITMVMEKAIHTGVPIVGIIDSEGARVEDAIQYYRFYSPESLVYFQTMASGVIPQISLIMGPCVGEMAISASLADFVFMVNKTSYMHVAPPPVGKTREETGDALVHARDTGCCDVLAENDEDCLQQCRELLSYLPSNNQSKPPVVDTGDDPNRREEELLGIVPFDTKKSFDMKRIISLIVDEGKFFELKPLWADNLIVGFGRLGGQTAGFVANDSQSLGGSLTLDAADKMARFVRFCDAFNIPLVWLADTPAFLPSVEEETRGLIRHGCKVVYSNTEASVPQITIAIRKLYGGGSVAMPGIALGGDLMMAWPSVERGLMGPEAAVSIIYKKELRALKDREEAALKQRHAQLVSEMRLRLKSSEREWAQDFIDPRDTRPFLINALNTFARREEERPRRKHENIRL